MNIKLLINTSDWDFFGSNTAKQPNSYKLQLIFSDTTVNNSREKKTHNQKQNEKATSLIRILSAQAAFKVLSCSEMKKDGNLMKNDSSKQAL